MRLKILSILSNKASATVESRVPLKGVAPSYLNFSFRRSASLISKVFETKNLQRIIFSSYCCVFFVLQCFAVVFFCFSFGFHIIGIVVIIFEIEVFSTLILLERFLIILFPFCFLLCSLAFLLLLFGSALAPFSLCFFFFFFSF